ncbi:MAG: hypothetical protein HKN82_15375 [Akkermansiaceae bacterium]|nr:hypothetical protein [Akkermansiaceae bacterium]
MTGREKRLLIILLAAVFVVANFAAYKLLFVPREAAAKARLTTAEAQLAEGQLLLDTQDQFEDEIAWLAKHEPEPATVQDTQTRLQQLMQREAQRNQLEIKRQRLQPSIEDPGLYFHRARHEMEVNGLEAGLYRWLDRLHVPNELRAITFMQINPQRDDDTRIDCKVVVEQWFVPETPSS